MAFGGIQKSAARKSGWPGRCPHQSSIPYVLPDELELT